MSLATDERPDFVRLLEEHGGIVQKVAASYSRTPADRHDLMQEIKLQLWKAWPRYSPERPFSTWTYRIALNVAISFLRRQSHPARQALSLEQLEAEPLAPNAGREAEDERVTVLQQVIASLPPLERGLLLLYLDDHSYREIAAVLGLTETNVATKLDRLKQRVREQMLQLSRTQS